jgi:hypothetical protein
MTDASTELHFQQPNLPSECPVCGAYSLAPDSHVSVLLAVCDVLVVKALEKVGNYILRSRERGSYQTVEHLAKHEIHTVWKPSERIVDKSVRNSWDVVPLILETHGGCCEYDATQVVELLDRYVHDLAITGTVHDIDELAYRLRDRLGLPVYRTVVDHHTN